MIVIKKGQTFKSLERWHQFGIFNLPKMNKLQMEHDSTLYRLTPQELKDTRNGIGLVEPNARQSSSSLCTILEQIIQPYAMLMRGHRNLRHGEPLCAVVLDADASHTNHQTVACLTRLNMLGHIIPGKAGPEADPLDEGIFGPFKASLKAAEHAEFRDWKLVHFEEILKWRRGEISQFPILEKCESGMEALDGTISRAVATWHSVVTRRSIKNSISRCYP